MMQRSSMGPCHSGNKKGYFFLRGNATWEDVEGMAEDFKLMKMSKGLSRTWFLLILIREERPSLPPVFSSNFLI